MQINLDQLTLCSVSIDTLDAVQNLEVLSSPSLESIETIGFIRNSDSAFNTMNHKNIVRRYLFKASLYSENECYQTVSMTFDFDSTFHNVHGDINKSIYLAEGTFVTCDGERKNELDTYMVQFVSKCIEVVYKRESKNEQHSDLRYDRTSTFKINSLKRDGSLQEQISTFTKRLADTTDHADLFVKHIQLVYSTNECSNEITFTLNQESIRNRCYELFFEGKLTKNQVSNIIKKAAKNEMSLNIDVLQIAVDIANKSLRTPQRFSSDELYYHYIHDLQCELVKKICDNPFNLFYTDLIISHSNIQKYLTSSYIASANLR